MSYLQSFPLLMIPIVVYNALAFFSNWTEEQFAECSARVEAEVHPLTCRLRTAAFKIPMATITTRRVALAVAEGVADPIPGSTESAPGTLAGPRTPAGSPGQPPPAVGVAPAPIVSPMETQGKLHLAVSIGDVLLTLSLLLLFAEVLSATGVQSSSIVNHALSLVVLIVGIVEFLTFPAFTTSVFFLIILMAMLDVLAGFIVTIAAVRRDLSFVSN